MSIRWTPELLDRVRALAPYRTSDQIAAELRVPGAALRSKAARAGIRFTGKPWQGRAERRETPLSVGGAMAVERARARLDLEHEIAAARDEAATAPLYRGWPA